VDGAPGRLLCPGVHDHLGRRRGLPVRAQGGQVHCARARVDESIVLRGRLCATIAALILTAYFGGGIGLRKLLARLIPWRAGLRWYLAILVGFPLVGLLAGRVAGLFGAAQGHVPNWAHFYYALIPALVIDPGPLGEELGWRGFALPRMLERWPPLTSSLILGLIWGLIWGAWHLPAFFIVGLPQNRLAIPALLLATMGISVIDTWIFLRTEGSLLR